ncbi:MAG: DUF2202 domain-containing protein [Bacteroidales bacterium]|nr:DUF2202 domain-containing protein [Bacteroidales bacterium]
MKKIQNNFIAVLLLAGAIMTFTQCSKENIASTSNQAVPAMKVSSADAELNGIDESETGTAAGTVNPMYSCINSFPVEPLSDDEINAINTMREEELLAKDIYTSMYALYHMPVFNNISKSENQHTGAIKVLMDKYDLPDIAANHVTGVFVNPDIQNLYNTLLAQGTVSLNGGLTVGATIEDLDIQDLVNHIANDVDNADILFVFNELERGSRNHLRSFYKLLKIRGITYVPQFITVEYFEEIINSPHEIGSGCPN